MARSPDAGDCGWAARAARAYRFGKSIAFSLPGMLSRLDAAEIDGEHVSISAGGVGIFSSIASLALRARSWAGHAIRR